MKPRHVITEKERGKRPSLDPGGSKHYTLRVSRDMFYKLRLLGCGKVRDILADYLKRQ